MRRPRYKETGAVPSIGAPSLLYHHALFPQLHAYGPLLYPFEMHLPKFQSEELALGVLQTDFVEGPPPLLHYPLFIQMH